MVRPRRVRVLFRCDAIEYVDGDAKVIGQRKSIGADFSPVIAIDFKLAPVIEGKFSGKFVEAVKGYHVVFFRVGAFLLRRRSSYRNIFLCKVTNL